MIQLQDTELLDSDYNKNDVTKIQTLFNMADGRHIGKHQFFHSSVVDCLIFAKFCTKTQNPQIMVVDCEFFKLWKFKMAVHRHLDSRYITVIAVKCHQILMKFPLLKQITTVANILRPELEIFLI